MTRKLVIFFRRHFPSGRTEGIQAWTIVLSVLALPFVPFLPLKVAVVVINLVSFIALAVAALAGLDSARNPD